MTVTETRPPLAKKSTPRTEKVRDEMLDRGIAFVEEDGTRISVTVGDIRGSHEAKLYAACGMGFMDLLEGLANTSRTDLLAAVVWFARLVNDRPNVGTYEDTLDEVGYEDFLNISDPKEPAEGDLPKAVDGDS